MDLKVIFNVYMLYMQTFQRQYHIRRLTHQRINYRGLKSRSLAIIGASVIVLLYICNETTLGTTEIFRQKEQHSTLTNTTILPVSWRANQIIKCISNTQVSVEVIYVAHTCRSTFLNRQNELVVSFVNSRFHLCNLNFSVIRSNKVKRRASMRI